MDTIVKSYPHIFPQGGAAVQDDGDAAEDTGAGAEPEGPDEYTAKWGWLSLVDTVSETQRCAWSEVWKAPMIETLNIYAYTKDRNARREDELERYKRTH